MIRTTPFHDRTSAANVSGLWEHWSGYLVAQKYQLSEKFEYFAIRNSAGLFDSSPLFKYRIHGPDAEAFLGGVLARDIRTCPVGHGQYTAWLDDRGFVVEDGVVFRNGRRRLPPDLRRAEPRLLRGPRRPPAGRARGRQRGVRGPVDPGTAIARHPRLDRAPGLRPAVLRPDDRPRSRAPGRRSRGPATPATSASSSGSPPTGRCRSGTRSRRRRLVRASIPFGMIALYMARIEAGLLLLDVDFGSSRYAWTDANRSTLIELGLGWMVRDLAADDRAFIGRPALERELRDQTSRWKLTGLVLDWQDYDRHYDAAGPDPAEGPHPDPGRVLRLRRRRHAARLRDEPDVLADAPAPHRPGPRAARSDQAGLARQARAAGQPPLRILRRRRQPGCRSTTPIGGPPDGEDRPLPRPPRNGHATDPVTNLPDRRAAERTYDAIVIGAGHNGLVNGAYLAKNGLKTLHPRAAPPRRRRGDHRGAPAGVLVHDVLLRPEPAPARHHPRPRARPSTGSCRS